ncbi:putative RNA-directed DNA polymerase from transposon BS [Nephila pilipes]|uniref:Putative RNA-directed DNA polymerase from transposon BS n=1 Tax=Nephila pilipes TaxID=299642 RepID=A0A8X6N3Q1_NEPPI|nr:putative RNA-directed DNA polymerase from transposon BS [Nephila pilipes]
MVAAFLMYISFFALYKREESLIETALYNGSKDFLFSCSMAWILFVCLVGEGGFMNRILSCKLFLPLSRLSYCVYLIHVSVAHRYHHMVEEISDFSTLSLMQMFFHVFLWSYLISFGATLLFEIPVVKLINQLTKLGKKISV